jgi:hypothetical protein
LLLSVLQNVDTKIEPTWVQPIDERNLLLCATISSAVIHAQSHRERHDNAPNRSAFCIDDQRRIQAYSFAVLPSSSPKAVCHSDVKNRVIAIRNDIDPEV